MLYVHNLFTIFYKLFSSFTLWYYTFVYQFTQINTIHCLNHLAVQQQLYYRSITF